MQPDVTLAAPPVQEAGLKVRVMGPDSPGPSSADLRRLFGGRRLSATRRDRLVGGGRVVAYAAGRVVGLAAYERLETQLRVHDFGIDDRAPDGPSAVAATLLDALEVACLAGGCRQLILLPHGPVDERSLAARGFRRVGGGDTARAYLKVFAI